MESVERVEPSMPAPLVVKRRPWWIRGSLALVAVLIFAQLLFMWFWSYEPAAFDPLAAARQRAAERGEKLVTGYVTTATLLELSETLLGKRGGYISNDKLPPGLFTDDMPNWEFGVLQQLRDLALAMRNDFSRSQTQSQDVKELSEAQPLYASPNDRWIIPSTEGQYSKANEFIESYLGKLGKSEQTNVQFYARADNLENYLGLVEKQLGSLSQRLSASVASQRQNTDLANEQQAQQSTPVGSSIEVQTPWMEIDNNFYEARGAAYALIHILKAVQHDFKLQIDTKNAMPSLQQIIRELEETQAPIWSPVILNGGGFGFFPNHSLVMANYISRANAQIADLRALLQNG